MSNYVKAVDFESKDSLTTGNPLKIIKGVELNDEFNAIQTAVATKADITSPAFLGNPTAVTQSSSDSSTRLATTAFVSSSIANAYPVGSIYINASISTNPATLFGFGTWEAFGSGKVLIGLDSGDVLFDTLGETGGSKDSVVVSHTHTATVTDPTHTHTDSLYNASDNGAAYSTAGSGNTGFPTGGTNSVNASATGVTVGISTDGVSGTDTNIQPYIVVYMWKRTV